MMIYVLVYLMLASISPGHAQQKAFVHDFHVKVQKISCKRCHGFVKYEKPKELVQKKLCHSCHVKNTPEKSPLSCKTCHGNVDVKFNNIRPPFHNIHNFQKEHAVFASQSKRSCMECHKPKDCSDCHNRSRSLSRSPHASFFLMTHGQEVKMGKMNCSSCHSKSSCTDCHRKSL